MSKPYLWPASAAALCMPLLAPAQPRGDGGGVAPTRPLHYESAFADYKPWRELSAADWRAVNVAVRPRSAAAGPHGGHDPSGAAKSPDAAPAAHPGASQPVAPNSDPAPASGPDAHRHPHEARP